MPTNQPVCIRAYAPRELPVWIIHAKQSLSSVWVVGGERVRKEGDRFIEVISLYNNFSDTYL